MMRVLSVVSALIVLILRVAGQNAPGADRLLVRRYTEGEQLRYLMKGRNNRHTYEVHITGTVKKGSDGRFVDEFAWSDMVDDGTPSALSPASQAFRVAITLEGGVPFAMPDLSKAQQMIGPVLDLMNFYADLFLAMHGGASFRQAGDHFHFANPATASWADGAKVIVGEDHIDFDVTLTEVAASNGSASLLIKHVPPEAPKIRLMADWMRLPVADTPNNWVQVEKTATGFTASVGRETFDVILKVGLSDGRILSATMENPVTAVARECSDAALTRCGDAKPDPTLRRIEMQVLHE